MKSTVLYHYYGPERRNGLCRSFNTKHCALTSAIYTLVRVKINRETSTGVTASYISPHPHPLPCLPRQNWKPKSKQNISILVVLLYSWQINVNTKKFQVLGDVYYGVQIAYFAIIGSQLAILVLSIVLIAGINSVSAKRFSHPKRSFNEMFWWVNKTWGISLYARREHPLCSTPKQDDETFFIKNFNWLLCKVSAKVPTSPDAVCWISQLISLPRKRFCTEK